MHQQGTDGNAAGIIARTDWGAALGAVYDSRPSALIICDGDADRAALEAMVEAAGARLLGAVGMPDALDRLDRIAAVRLLVVKAGDGCQALARILPRIEHMAEMDGVASVVAVPHALLNDAFAALSAPQVQLLCDPAEAEIAAAIALAAQPAPRVALHDIGRESEALRLQHLSEEVSRIARTLASLSGGGGSAIPLVTQVEGLAEAGAGYGAEPAFDIPRAHSAPAVTARDIRDMLRLRRLRDQFFPGELFADPAWDMLLDLMAARLSGQRVSVSSLCIAAAVPATTALRWIRALTDNGLFLRQADPADGRRVFIALSDKAAEAMTSFFAAAKRGGKAMMA